MTPPPRRSLSVPRVGSRPVRHSVFGVFPAPRALMALLVTAGWLSISNAGCVWQAEDAPCPHGEARNDMRLCPSGKAPRTGALDRPSPLPGDAPRTPCPSHPAVLRLHEVLIDPDGPDGGFEWVELWAETDGQADGYSVVVRTSALEKPTLRVPLFGPIDAHSFVMVSDSHEHATPMNCTAVNGCLRNTGGVIDLYDCHGERVDSVAWGQATTTHVRPKSGQALAYCESDDAWGLAAPTPASANGLWVDPRFCAAPCAMPDLLLINEVLYDLVGADNGGEFIELWGAPSTSVDGTLLHGINGSDGKPLFKPIALTGETDANGYYLIGGTDIDGRDATLPTQLQNGPEALYLEGCDGTWLDATTYGGTTPHLTPYGPETPVLPPGTSLGRLPDGATSADAFEGVEPTPRAPNRKAP